MSEPNPSIKRRRLDAAASTLSKPFKSPLRPQAKKPDEMAEAQPSPTTHTTQQLSQNDNDNDAIKNETPNSPPNPKPSTPTLKHKLPSHSPSSSYTDPHLSSLQKQHTTLLTHLSSLRHELDTTRQALKIEEKGKDEELEELVAKWKGAGRLAAEELYAGARERVNRMGGVGVLREREREGRKRRVGWEGGGEGNKGEEEECDKEKGEEENGKGGEDDEDEDEEDSFTMDMMLKSLNIELGVIGFDKDEQRWVD